MLPESFIEKFLKLALLEPTATNGWAARLSAVKTLRY